MLNWSTAMAFDFGLSKIGVAIGQSITKSASPIHNLKAKNGCPNWHDVNKLINEWQPDAIIVGLPLNIDGTEQPITKKAKEFLETIKKKYQLPTFLVDERFTTKSAKEQVFEQHGYKGLKKIPIDSIAAVLILEQWINDNTDY